MYYTIKLCKGKGAYEAIPQQKQELDLSSASSKLESAGYSILSNNPVMLVVQKSNKIHIYPGGKLKIEVESKKKAEEIAKEVCSIIEK